MKNYIYILCLIFFNLPDSIAQQRFSKVLRKGYRAAAFYNAFMVKDTIMATGTVLDSTWGAWFVKMDTTGKILLEKQYKMNPIPEFYLSNNSRGFIKTSDGGFAIIGETYFSNQGVFIKIKNNGELDFIKYYSRKDEELTIWFKRIVEFSNGYFILGEKEIKGLIYPLTTLIKVDKEGNLIWTKIYDATKEKYLDIDIEPNQSIRLSGGALLDGKGVPVISYIDTSGKEIKRIWGEKGRGTGAFFLQKINKGWVYVNIEAQLSTGLQQTQHDYWINITDENFKLLEHKKIGFTTDISMPNTLSKLNNDEYAALLSMKPKTQIPATLSYDGAFIQKFNGKGDLLWSRMDTIFWETSGNQCKNEYVSALALPSGNIIVLGWAQKCYGSDDEIGAYAWVVKLSKDGCLLEPACGISATGENFDIQEFRAFPNPTSSIFTLEWKVPNESIWHLYLRDYSGRIVQQSEIESGALRHTLQVDNLGNGLYFYELRASSGKQIESGKMIIQN